MSQAIDRIGRYLQQHNPQFTEAFLSIWWKKCQKYPSFADMVTTEQVVQLASQAEAPFIWRKNCSDHQKQQNSRINTLGNISAITGVVSTGKYRWWCWLCGDSAMLQRGYRGQCSCLAEPKCDECQGKHLTKFHRFAAKVSAGNWRKPNEQGRITAIKADTSIDEAEQISGGECHEVLLKDEEQSSIEAIMNDIANEEDHSSQCRRQD